MGGGDSNKATIAGQQAAAEEQYRIQQGMSQINGTFDNAGRQKQYDQFLQARRQDYTGDLNRVQEEATRNLKFALARNGQYGGSVQTDSAVESARRYNEGVLQAERAAQGDVAGLKQSDESTRSALISMLLNGGSTSDLASKSLLSQQNNLQAGQAERKTDLFGDIASSFSNVIQKSKDNAEYRRGLQQGVTLYGQGGW